jgi:hypothetical protein
MDRAVARVIDRQIGPYARYRLRQVIDIARFDWRSEPSFEIWILGVWLRSRSVLIALGGDIHPPARGTPSQIPLNHPFTRTTKLRVLTIGFEMFVF